MENNCKTERSFFDREGSVIIHPRRAKLPRTLTRTDTENSSCTALLGFITETVVHTMIIQDDLNSYFQKNKKSFKERSFCWKKDFFR